jgi:peptidoglycan hydrolase-like protein with peptidoglycan-binding domain
MPQDLTEPKPEKKGSRAAGLLGLVILGFAVYGCTSLFAGHGGSTPPEPPASQPKAEAKPNKAQESPPQKSAVQSSAPKAKAEPPSDQKVMELQRLLIEVGEPVDETGVMNEQTKHGVEAFQRQHGLTVDGVAGPKTMAAIYRAINGSNDNNSSSGSATTSCEQTFGDFCLLKQWTSSDEVAGYIEGTIRNDSDRAYSYVQVEVNTYDSSGTTQVGSEMDNVNNLAPHGTWHFKVMIMRDTPGGRYRIVGVTGW